MGCDGIGYTCSRKLVYLIICYNDFSDVLIDSKSANNEKSKYQARFIQMTIAEKHYL
jgi:hypothetical protein